VCLSSAAKKVVSRMERESEKGVMKVRFFVIIPDYPKLTRS
jgi:hypothetical protein